MLNGVSTLVGCYGCSCYGIAIEYAFSEVYCFVCGVVVVGELTSSADDLYVVDAIVVEHFACHVGTCHS